MAQIGYVLLLHVNARHAGVAQNRPRFILIGVNKDYYEYQDEIVHCDNSLRLLKPAVEFAETVGRQGGPTIELLPLFDSEKGEHRNLMKIAS